MPDNKASNHTNGLSRAEHDKIAAKLKERGVHLPCPRCGGNDFLVADGYFNQPIQAELGSLVLGGKSLPSVVVVCKRCGYISQHAVGVLGMLPTGEADDE